jgi:hypothetical protein
VAGGDRRAFYLAMAELARRHVEAPVGAGADLTRFELSVFSQNGEDGVIAEILRRVGPGPREFVEFGIGRGTEGNCVALADVLGWSGLFMEGAADDARGLAWKYRASERVRTREARITADNLDGLLAEAGVSTEPDVFSIDIDGNDVWVWRALRHARPRLVIVEYNAQLDPHHAIAQPYDPAWVWQGTDWFGASLGALELVGREQGYTLVHTELSGVNAFFVRDDLADRFADVTEVPRRSQNYGGEGYGHPAHAGGGEYVELVPR